MSTKPHGNSLVGLHYSSLSSSQSLSSTKSSNLCLPSRREKRPRTSNCNNSKRIFAAMVATTALLVGRATGLVRLSPAWLSSSSFSRLATTWPLQQPRQQQPLLELGHHHRLLPSTSPATTRTYTTTTTTTIFALNNNFNTNSNIQTPATARTIILRSMTQSSTSSSSSTSEDNDTMGSSSSSSDNDACLDRTWNVPVLRKEISRLTVRCHKKIGKASQRLEKAKMEVDRLASNEDVSMEELEACPNLDQLEMDLHDLQRRLKQLNQLEVLLQDIKSKMNDVMLPEHIIELVITLKVDDNPPAKQQEERVKKTKGPKTMTSFRLPYRRFYSENGIEIRVGKQAQDNDELSLNPQHRDSLDWWMHASGCPGSHVIIRCQGQSLPDEVVMDAAALAARQSKCQGTVIKVSMVRARDVSKPPGAKAGLVQLNGSVRTITVNMKDARGRLERLDKSVLIN